MTRDHGQLDEVHLALRRLLKNHCRGEGRARKQADLVRDLRAQGHTRALVRLRVGDAEAVAVPLDGQAIFYLLRDLRLADCPVMGSSAGMFWAQTFDEFVRAKANYTSRFREMGHVARAFERIERTWRERRTRAVPAAPPPMRQQSLLPDTGPDFGDAGQGRPGTIGDERGESGTNGDESPIAGPPSREGGGPNQDEARGGPAPGPPAAGRARPCFRAARPAQGQFFDPGAPGPGARAN